MSLRATLPLQPYAFAKPVAVPRFRGAPENPAPQKEPETKYFGGVHVETAPLIAVCNATEPVIMGFIDELEKNGRGGNYPPIEKILGGFGLENINGLPPALIDKKNASKTTHGAIAIIAIDYLKRLPAARNGTEAVGQLIATLQTLTTRSVEKAKTHVGDNENLSYKPSKGLSPFGFTVWHMPSHNIYSALQTGHMVFISPEGALKILKMPTAAEMGEMIKSDAIAQHFIRTYQPLGATHHNIPPLPHHKKWLRKQPITLEQTMEVFTDGNERNNGTGWRDTHSVLQYVPFDYEKHIREGRMKVLLDKPGANGEYLALPAGPRQYFTA